MKTHGGEPGTSEASPRTAHEGQEPRPGVLPTICDVSVTNVCNAACDFCGFSRDKRVRGARRYLDVERFVRALPILRRHGIRHLTYQGGEPLLHPKIVQLVLEASRSGIQCGLITNGWFLPRFLAPLSAAGLKRLLISIDSDRLSIHEKNRGLRRLVPRIKESIDAARTLGIPVWASVTVNRLLNIEALPEVLAALGFDAVAFSYPRHDAFGSTSLAYGDDSELVDYTPDELLAALGQIRRLKRRFRVFDPDESLAEVGRFLRGEKQLVPCIGGHKYFYIDWNLDLWRCEAWPTPMGSVFDWDSFPEQRDVCNACIMACYRHASMLMHAPIAAEDSVKALIRGELRSAAKTLFGPGVLASLRSLAREQWPGSSLSALASKARRLPRQGPALESQARIDQAGS
jgi:MoaA/NifB/PqqE/SkfB family radical SAM enzyme